MVVSYQELSSDKNDDASIAVGGLGIEGRNLVLDFLEVKTLSHWLALISCLISES